MITEEQAAHRAELILELPADDPDHSWELQEFPQGWLRCPEASGQSVH
jgi:hypothetical protein